MTKTMSASQAHKDSHQNALPGLDGLLGDPDAKNTVQDQLLPVARIRPSPKNARRGFDEEKVKQMMKGIALSGLEQPITVKPVARGYYEVVFGHTRLEAYKRLGRKLIPARIRTDYTPERETLARIKENYHRSDLTPYEQGLEFQEALRLMSQKQLCAETGLSSNTIKARLALLEFPEEIGTRVGVKGFSMQHARALEPLWRHALAMKVAVDLIEAGKVPPAEKFLDRVAGALLRGEEAVNAYDYAFYDARRDPAFEDLVVVLPHLRYKQDGYRDALLVLDVARFKEVVQTCKARQDVEQRRQEAEAEGSAVLKDEATALLAGAEYDRALEAAVAEAVEAARIALDARKREEVLQHLRRAARPAEAFQAILVALGGVGHQDSSTVASIAGISEGRLPWSTDAACKGPLKVSKQVTADKLLRAVAFHLISKKQDRPWTRLASIWQGKETGKIIEAAQKKAAKEAQAAFVERVGARRPDTPSEAVA